MSSTIRGLQTNELRPSYDLELTRSREGLWTASQSYTCRYTDYGSNAMSNKLRKGTPITDLFSDIPIKYEFISLESHKVTHQKGGLTKIHCTFSGASDDDGWGSFDSGSSVSYSYRGVLAQAPIIEHPKYLAQVTGLTARAAISALWHEAATMQDDNGAFAIYRKVDGVLMDTFTDDESKAWISLIVAGRKFYDKPMLEWTVTEANKGGMRQSSLNKFGRRENNPPGDPLVPQWADPNGNPLLTHGWWHFTSLTEDRDENSSSYSRTYTLKDEPYIALLYD